MTSHNATRLEGQKAEKFCIFISILVLLILIMLIKIDIMHNAEISQYNLNFTYSDIQYGIKISLPEALIGNAIVSLIESSSKSIIRIRSSPGAIPA